MLAPRASKKLPDFLDYKNKITVVLLKFSRKLADPFCSFGEFFFITQVLPLSVHILIVLFKVYSAIKRIFLANIRAY
jgi:hypothetical protein